MRRYNLISVYNFIVDYMWSVDKLVNFELNDFNYIRMCFVVLTQIPAMNVSICFVIVENEVNNSDSWLGPFPVVYISQEFDIYNTADKCDQWTLTSSIG